MFFDSMHICESIEQGGVLEHISALAHAIAPEVKP